MTGEMVFWPRGSNPGRTGLIHFRCTAFDLTVLHPLIVVPRRPGGVVFGYGAAAAMMLRRTMWARDRYQTVVLARPAVASGV
jgi:hypothetical protein